MFARIAKFVPIELLLPLIVAAFFMGTDSLFAQVSQVPGTVTSYAEGQLKTIQGQNSTRPFTIDRANKAVLNRSVTSTGTRGINQQRYVNLQGNQSLSQRSSKPFSMIDRGPVVSPYLQLDNPLSTAADYYNVVKPLQEQRRVNDRLMQQQYKQASKLNQIAAQGPYQITGNEEAAPTGHSTGFMKYGTYMNMGGYFAPQTQPKQDKR